MDNFTNTLAYSPVPEWGKVMDLGDYPHDYFMNFGAIVCNVISLVFPNDIAKPIIELAAHLAPTMIETFTGLESPTPSARKWITEEYMPEILKATKVNNIPAEDRLWILQKLVGSLVKLVYAFAYQE